MPEKVTPASPAERLDNEPHKDGGQQPPDRTDEIEDLTPGEKESNDILHGIATRYPRK